MLAGRQGLRRPCKSGGCCMAPSRPQALNEIVQDGQRGDRTISARAGGSRRADQRKGACATATGHGIVFLVSSRCCFLRRCSSALNLRCPAFLSAATRSEPLGICCAAARASSASRQALSLDPDFLIFIRHSHVRLASFHSVAAARHSVRGAAIGPRAQRSQHTCSHVDANSHDGANSTKWTHVTKIIAC